MQNLIPPAGRLEVIETVLICKSTQQTENVTAYSPTLQAMASDRVLLRYQENGHVTLSDRYNSGDFPMKPTSGTVWVYGTNKPTPEDTLMGIHGVWDEKGTGGDGRGVLLTSAPFDDGMCYQVNDSEESARRQALPQRPHTKSEGRDLWCGVEVELPSELAPGTTYTLYWVWEWPTLLNEQPQQWKQEDCTTCIDVEIV